VAILVVGASESGLRQVEIELSAVAVYALLRAGERSVETLSLDGQPVNGARVDLRRRDPRSSVVNHLLAAAAIGAARVCQRVLSGEAR